MKGVLAAKMAGAKVVWHLNDTELPWILRVIFNMIGGLCNGFIVAGSKVYQFYLNGNRLQKKKFIEIQAPVDTAYLSPENVVRNELIGKDKKIKIVTMGTINPTKRIEDFIRVANILGKKNENLSFYIVGPELDSQKQYMRRLKELVRYYRLNNILFLGARNDIPSILKAIDIYVCTSETEASPMAVWEAMAMEKAIVSTDVGDVKRFIRDGENGFIVPPRDVEALAKKVSILIEDEDLRAKFGKLARIVALRELDLEICAQRHKDFYRSVLGLGSDL
jgi:glycosyltransferase involved in cell wall biosynthesis